MVEAARSTVNGARRPSIVPSPSKVVPLRQPPPSTGSHSPLDSLASLSLHFTSLRVPGEGKDTGHRSQDAEEGM